MSINAEYAEKIKEEARLLKEAQRGVVYSKGLTARLLESLNVSKAVG